MLRDGAFSHCKVWESLGDAWQRKCDRVGLSRWFAFAKGIREFVPLWHKRAAGSLYLVLNEGVFKGQSPSELVKLRVAPAPTTGDDIPSERTAAGPTLKQLRAATQNTLHLVATVLMDEHMYHLAKLLSRVLQPVQEAHSAQRVSCRSILCGGFRDGRDVDLVRRVSGWVCLFPSKCQELPACTLSPTPLAPIVR